MTVTETRSRVDQLLDMRLNIQARAESGSWSQEKAHRWIAHVDYLLEQWKAGQL